ncbi:MAG: hypothetical protein VX127_07990 [Myxococcota bacterium]|nr:hypothetical protein [Myxococcota bacterium]
MNRASLLLAVAIGTLTPVALAQESTDEPTPPSESSDDETAEPPGAADSNTTLPEDANPEQLPTLSRAQHRWLEPKRSRLPSVAHGQTDFSAYTLEWGETKIGLASVTLGALPRTQIGTVPALNFMGVYNGHLKVNALRLGPYALGVGTNLHRLYSGEFVGAHTGVSVIQSVQVLKPWGLHVGMRFADLQSSGVPDISSLPRVLTGNTDTEQIQASLEGTDDSWRFHGQTFAMNVATDVRFNRRDSLLLQASATVWARVVERGFEAPPILGLDEAFNLNSGTTSPIAETYTASASWQFSWRRVDLRVGAGISNVPGAWLLQSTDLSYRFGGKTRTTERRMKRTWKRNKSDTREP